MRRFLRFISRVLIVALVVLGGLSLLTNTVLKDTPFVQLIQGAANSAGNAAANIALDASGIKGKIDGALREHAGDIASATGLSESQVNSAIDDLAIESWSVTTLPDTAQAQSSYNASYQGVDATVTTYADPGYVTVSTAGQDFTLAVPESAQGYMSLLGYL